MLTPLHGTPLIDWVIRRASKALKIDELIVVIPDSEPDNELENHLRDINARVLRGTEHDVLTRFHQAATSLGASHILRICGDNPLVCPHAIDELVDFFFNQKLTLDYAYNHIPDGNSWPDGLGAEICTMHTLSKIHKEATHVNDREHIFNYLREKPDKFRIKTFDPSDMQLARPELKLDVDYPRDLANLALLEIHPEMDTIDIINQFKKASNTII